MAPSALREPMPIERSGERVRGVARELVRRYGRQAISSQVLGDGYAYFVDGEGERAACVAYVDTGTAWVAAGEPVCDVSRTNDVARAFVRAARDAGRRAVFFGVERELGDDFRATAIGEEPAWDPREWGHVLREHGSLREQLRRARAKGVRVYELDAEQIASGPIRDAMGRLVERWLATRPMAPMGFVVRTEPFERAKERRCFVAEEHGEIVGLASLLPVPARNGLFIEHLLRSPDAPNGTSELLVDAVMRASAEENIHYVTLGMTPLSGDVPRSLLRLREATRFLYDFAGVHAYKTKLRPTSWARAFVALPRTESTVMAFVEVLRAFAGGGLVAFAWRSLMRGSPAVLRILTVLLVPWTLLLALAPAEPWFGSDAVKWAWVAFDVLLIAGLARALRKASATWLTALALAVTFDATVTTCEALLWNASRVRGVGDVVVLLVACAAPTFAAFVLWGARRTCLRRGGHHAEPSHAWIIPACLPRRKR